MPLGGQAAGVGAQPTGEERQPQGVPPGAATTRNAAAKRLLPEILETHNQSV